MNGIASQLEISPVPIDDQRWELLERIIASPSFVKSPRLCGFLTLICELSLQNRDDEINELNIGERLFGRARNYDPSVDGIVRSHASRLRQRLEQYFSEEGATEPMRLSIPKGGYVPVFEPLVAPDAASEAIPPESHSSPSAGAGLPNNSATATKGEPARLWLWILSVALALSCGCILYLVDFARPAARASAQPIPDRAHPLWSKLFAPDSPITVVCSDTGLTILENLTHSNVNLADYLSGDYRTHLGSSVGATPDVVRTLAEHRYTSIVDVEIVSKLYRQAGSAASQIHIHYSRDVRLSDLKTGSVLLLGTQEGTPWVELYANRMNFTIQHNRQWGAFSVFNRAPQGNELARYEANKQDPLHKVYGLVALRPSLGGSGNVLILEGTSMAGTESAADFVFDDTRLLPFLDKIRNPDQSIPFFEVLLQSSNMNGDASQSEIVAYRTSAQ
jgi:hypothetical protein